MVGAVRLRLRCVHRHGAYRVGVVDIPVPGVSGAAVAAKRPGRFEALQFPGYRLLFISRARRMSLSCDQISELLPVWAGTNCGAAHERVSRLIEDKQADIATRIADLESFAAQLDVVRAALDASPPPSACRTDLSCCVPDAGATPVPVDFFPTRATHAH